MSFMQIRNAQKVGIAKMSNSTAGPWPDCSDRFGQLYRTLANMADSQPFRSRANSLPGANRPIGPWPIRSLELSLPGTFVPRSELAREHSLPGTFALKSIRSQEHSLSRTFVPC